MTCSESKDIMGAFSFQEDKLRALCVVKRSGQLCFFFHRATHLHGAVYGTVTIRLSQAGFLLKRLNGWSCFAAQMLSLIHI